MEESVRIAESLGEIKSTLSLMQQGQGRLFNLVDGFQTKVARLETQHEDTEDRIEKVENITTSHANELAEARGSNKTNRLLIIIVPSFITGLWEIFKSIKIPH